MNTSVEARKLTWQESQQGKNNVTKKIACL